MNDRCSLPRLAGVSGVFSCKIRKGKQPEECSPIPFFLTKKNFSCQSSAEKIHHFFFLAVMRNHPEWRKPCYQIAHHQWLFLNWTATIVWRKNKHAKIFKCLPKRRAEVNTWFFSWFFWSFSPNSIRFSAAWEKYQSWHTLHFSSYHLILNKYNNSFDQGGQGGEAAVASPIMMMYA